MIALHRRLLNIIISVFIMLSASLAYSDLVFDSGWVRALPPTQPNTAAFFRLTNNSGDAVILKQVSSDIAAKAEYHTHSKGENGMMAMRQLKQVVIEPKATVEFKPGGYHVMLFDLVRPLKSGEQVEIRLIDSDGKQYAFNLPVKSPMEEPSHGHHHHH
ncbi:copper chaperone PCu(A)C [Bermanella sp. R86510]|uniref:copper chaperone PCu(A)C n=1 Tax=unclassified Bermanella TaxID=2627862 RepID=UPI0037C5DC21